MKREKYEFLLLCLHYTWLSIWSHWVVGTSKKLRQLHESGPVDDNHTLPAFHHGILFNLYTACIDNNLYQLWFKVLILFNFRVFIGRFLFWVSPNKHIYHSCNTCRTYKHYSYRSILGTLVYLVIDHRV